MTAKVLEGDFSVSDDGTLNASSAEVVTCGDNCIGINLLDRKDTIFAHCHWDPDTALVVATQLAAKAREQLVARGVTSGH